MTESTDTIRLFLDDDVEPFKTARPPLRFQFSTLHLADGPHRLRVEAHNGLAGDSVKEIPFSVRNGVAISVSGIQPLQEIAGQVGVIVNAYAGNTEVDFEPSRAETPQPIPTWAWLIFLVISAWTMFYVLNPHSKPTVQPTTAVFSGDGSRVYIDLCGKCHGEDGLGAPGFGPAKLKDADTVINPDPTDLVAFVAAGPLPDGSAANAPETGSGRPRVKMLAFGPPRLTRDDFVGAVNYLRNHWGNQAALITPRATRAPKAIQSFDAEYVKALQDKSTDRLSNMYARYRDVRMVRPTDATPVDVSTNEAIVETLRNWLNTIGDLNSLQVEDAAYFVTETEDVCYAHGRLTLTVSPSDGSAARPYAGEFIRVYVREASTKDAHGECVCDIDGKPIWAWRLAFDYATTPMPIGCPPSNREGERCDPKEVGRITYADVQRILSSLGQRAPRAPHANFWELPYDKFVAFSFEYPPLKDKHATIRLINVDKAAGITGAETNLVKALRDGRDVLVDVPGEAAPLRVDIKRMPKDTKPVSQVDIGRIIAWIDHGMVEKVAQAPNVPPTVPAMNGGPVPGPVEPPPAAGAGDWLPDDLDFAGVIALIKSWNPKASGSPHGAFWNLAYDKFMDYSFDIPSEGVKAHLVVKGEPDKSNLLVALTGKPLIVERDGKPTTLDLGRAMPPKGKGAAPSPADVERIRRWIAHGAPEHKPAGGGGEAPAMNGGSPPATPAPATPTPPATPPAAPTPATPPPAPAGMDGTAGTPAAGVDYAGVLAILNAMNPKASGSPHGAIWKLPYDKFMSFTFDIPSDGSKAPLIVKGDPERSNLVRALEGKPLIVVVDGKETTHEMDAPMPPKGKGRRATPEEIAQIRAWIAAGAPEKR